MVADCKLRPINVSMRMQEMKVVKISLLAFFVLLTSCASPGEGAKAKSGYSAAAPVIAALDAYHGANAAYPSSLNELVPKFITSNDLNVVFPDKKATTFKYRRVYDGYELSFAYTGPGTNQCVYREKTKTWQCYGAY